MNGGIGKRFNRLMIIERAGNDGRTVIWRCQCDCGKEYLIKDKHLRKTNGIQSCGCLKLSKLQSDTITCKRCHRTLPRDQYYKKWANRGDTRHNICKDCSRIALCESKKKYERRTRIEALTHYGGNPPACACCGENRIEFLTIDHIHGGGSKHRRELGNAGTRIARWLKKAGYPDGFRVLCYNCNCAIGAYGECPHTRECRPGDTDEDQHP